jgi:P-type conjugative transfer protein TrbJ
MSHASKRWAAAWLAASLTLVTAAPGQTVFCTNCASEITQLANNIQLVDQLARQVQLVQQALQQTENMVTNTRPLDGQQWGDTLASIRKLNELLGQAKSLSFAGGNLEAEFSKKFQDYNAYRHQQQPGEDALSGKLQQWSEDTNASVLSTLKAAGLSSEQLEGEEDSYLRQLEDRATSAEGRMQAIQVGNQIAMAGVRQTQKLRHMMLVQMQLLANFVAQRGDKETAEAAYWRQFSKPLDLSPNNGQRY